MTTAPSIHVSNIGPVVEFELEMGTPGLWVLRGRQGSGKSTITRVADLLVNGATNQQLTKRDGAKRGEATVCGATLRIMQTRREEGELSPESKAHIDQVARDNQCWILTAEAVDCELTGAPYRT